MYIYNRYIWHLHKYTKERNDKQESIGESSPFEGRCNSKIIQGECRGNGQMVQDLNKEKKKKKRQRNKKQRDPTKKRKEKG